MDCAVDSTGGQDGGGLVMQPSRRVQPRPFGWPLQELLRERTWGMSAGRVVSKGLGTRDLLAGHVADAAVPAPREGAPSSAPHPRHGCLAAGSACSSSLFTPPFLSPQLHSVVQFQPGHCDLCNPARLAGAALCAQAGASTAVSCAQHCGCLCFARALHAALGCPDALSV